MFRQLGLLGAALALFAMAGGHWAVLQSVAWAGMLADYSQQSGSVVTGFERTFDGQHACELCRAIASGKSGERKGSDAAFGAKDDTKVKALPMEAAAPVGERTAAAVEFCRVVPGRVVARAEQPPTPPPRRVVRAA